MTDTDPTPPAALPDDVVETLSSVSPERLRTVADYATALADAREGKGESGTNQGRRTTGQADGDVATTNGATGGTTADDTPDNPPPDVPSKATLTVKSINDNRYYYWQWRDGDSVRSQYVGPVDDGT